MYSESCTQLRYKGFDRDVKINFTFLHIRCNAQKEHEACMCECCPVWPLQLITFELVENVQNKIANKFRECIGP